jgi:ADP-ribosyl-[dinitrogen reductase] hydrolase
MTDTAQRADRARGCLLGLAVGDALGTTLEFARPGTFQPITDMVGGGPFHLTPGEWTDDTSMALCLAVSLIARRGFDAKDQMDRYENWRLNGYLSATGACFDIGGTVLKALYRYRDTGNPFAGSEDPNTAGNGSIMRLAPVSILYHWSPRVLFQKARDSSRTTHAAPRCLNCCMILAEMCAEGILGVDKDAIVQFGMALPPMTEPKPTGYVVDTLQAALWAFRTTYVFREGALKAVNLGGDADTVGAVYGQIAGAFYGESGIPQDWLKRLKYRGTISKMADTLFEMARFRNGLTRVKGSPNIGFEGACAVCGKGLRNESAIFRNHVDGVKLCVTCAEK